MKYFLRDSWDISPTLAVFLPSWLSTGSPALALEVSRLVRCAPTKVGSSQSATPIGRGPPDTVL